MSRAKKPTHESRWGGGSPAPPPSGGRLGGGLNAANDGHLSRPCDSRTTPDEHRLGARAARPRRVSAGKVTAPLPSPPPAGGRESGSSPQRGEVRGGGQRRMRVGEQPMFTVAVHAACAAHRRDEHPSWEGGARPNPPAGGVWGNPVSPSPCWRARPSRGRGYGGTWFPHVHVSRPCRRAAHRPMQTGVGGTWFPQVHGSGARAGWAAPASFSHHGNLRHKVEFVTTL